MDTDEAAIIRDATLRLAKALPDADPTRIRQSVRIAYEELRYARVRTYLPILMERRAKDLLTSDPRLPPLDEVAG
ncbi:three-helix bundle dimerization domain-containing protein [Streptomyces sp. NBC_00829]|uniref:three-helix bundle dimerization domain-containing protein n=1 Tax=Streptomyces sp. NBC_00829 TaxID=2903679 RepID=UPI003870C4AD|nr:hypothetical protein OG293_38985 [Streptomyces sp. NBC_00829]